MTPGDIVLFDTETTGLPAKGQAMNNFTHPGAPHLVELAGIRLDWEGNELGRVHHIVRPDGFTIPTAASNVHGITTEIAYQQGADRRAVLDEFENLLSGAVLVVAHNFSYDRMIMGCVHHRAGMKSCFESLQHMCTKLALRDVIKMRKASGSGYKWPSLLDAHRKFFDCGFEGAHGAMTDTEALKRVFLVGRHFCPEVKLT
jgi:DNA polymerase III epsilon subunit-like protein